MPPAALVLLTFAWLAQLWYDTDHFSAVLWGRAFWLLLALGIGAALRRVHQHRHGAGAVVAIPASFIAVAVHELRRNGWSEKRMSASDSRSSEPSAASSADASRARS